MTGLRRVNPPDDAQQILRINRNLAAAGSSLLVILLLTFYWREGYLGAHAYGMAVAMIVVLIVVFQAIFRTGLNTRAADPSLTMAQVASACAVLVFINFHLQAARGAFLLVYIMAVIFAVFRLNTKQILLVVVPILIAHVGSIFQMRGRGIDPEIIRLEFIQWVVLVVVLLWFSQLGGYISNMRRRLRSLAVRDALTDAYSRRHMTDMLAAEKARAHRSGSAFCIVLIDLDRFKSINDVHGHGVGDQVLVDFAALVKRHVRIVDHVGRYGGEEFLLLLPDTQLSAAVAVAQRIREATRAADWSALTAGLVVTVSIGVHEPGRDESIEQALEQADAALYRAKHAGRDRVEYAAPASEPQQPLPATH